MLSPDAALDLILAQARPLPLETVFLQHARTRILGDDIISTIDVPAFDKAAMDGFAYDSADMTDTAQEWRIIETIPAGRAPRERIGPGLCSRIMTGAMMPDGADRVVPVEHTEEHHGIMSLQKRHHAPNMCRRGENIAAGHKVLSAGTPLRPQEIATLAALGLSSVRVFAQPRVGVLSTGTELVAPGEPLRPACCYDSNGLQLYHQALELGVPVVPYGICADDPEHLEAVIARALAECEVVLISGGISQGDFDYIPGLIRNLGVSFLFQHLAVKPGRPTLFGTRNHVSLFGLPGNPVAAFLMFEILAKPLIYHLMGHAWRPRPINAPIRESFHRKKTDRTEFIPAQFDGNTVTLLPYQGPSHINSLCLAQGVIRLEPQQANLGAGESVPFFPFGYPTGL
jgi:molybdopterin molybdotransferase